MLSIRHARPRGFVLAVVVLLCGSASAAQQWPAQRGGSGGGDAVLPIGVHLAPGDAADSLVVSWSTVAPAQSVVQYVTEGGVEVQTAGGECTPFASSHSRTVWLHAVRLVGLPLGGVRHTYRAGSDTGWSDDLSFASPPRPWAADAAPLRLLAICDLGVPNVGDTDPRRRAAFDAATADATRSHYDAVLDCGDFGYDMHDEHGARADRFFEMVQPLAATHPFLVSPGNHEQSSNFSAYRARFQMPAAPGSDGLWWSRDVGPVHIVSYSTEVLFWPAFYGETTWRRQYAWLADDLALADANRAAVPWVVVMGHRPMYCVASPGGDPARCDGEHEASRSGTPAACGVRDGNFHNCDPRSDEYPAEPELEGLLHAHGVDVAMYGHIHLYARFWPTLRGKVLATGPGAYSDPPATVFITNGGGGNHEMRLGQGGAPSSGECPAPWCAFESGWRGGRDNALSADFGYARIAVANASHLAWEQVSATRGGAVVDAWTLVRSSGAPAFGRRALSRRLSALRQR